MTRRLSAAIGLEFVEVPTGSSIIAALAVVHPRTPSRDDLDAPSPQEILCGSFADFSDLVRGKTPGGAPPIRRRSSPRSTTSDAARARTTATKSTLHSAGTDGAHAWDGADFSGGVGGVGGVDGVGGVSIGGVVSTGDGVGGGESAGRTQSLPPDH